MVGLDDKGQRRDKACGCMLKRLSLNVLTMPTTDIILRTKGQSSIVAQLTTLQLGSQIVMCDAFDEVPWSVP